MLRTTRVWLAASISVSRLVAAILFAAFAFQDVPLGFVLGLYAYAMVSDLIDGFLARTLNATSYAGQIVDLVSDKSLTIVSLMYAAVRGIHILPLALIATRDIISIGARLIIVEGQPLLPTNRTVGGLMAILIWGNTMYLMTLANNSDLVWIANCVYWLCALLMMLILSVRVYRSRKRIRASWTQGQ